MLLLIESGIRGWIATISHRHAKANNEYMGAEFDPTKKSKFISYLDVNGLYSWAMSKPLPNVWIWMDDRWWNWWLETSELYPWRWFRVSGGFTQPSQWLPSCSGTRKMRNVEKLIPNLNNKSNYVVLYENLKLYKNLGLKIAKIHRGIKFEGSAWWKNTLI